MRRIPHATLLLRIAFALAFSFLITQFKLDFIESYLDDLRFRFRPASTTSNQIELILIDQATVESFKRIPNYADHRDVVKTILEQDPKALLYVTHLVKMGDSEEDKGRAQSSPTGTPEEAIALAETLTSSPKTFQMTDRMVLKGEHDTMKMPAPFEKVPLLSAPKTSDNNLFAKDGVTRRLLIDYQGEPLGHVQIASEFNPEIRDFDKIHGQFIVYETRQVLIDYRTPGSFSVTKFEDFIRKSVDPTRFRGKLVLIGDDLGKSLKSYVLTPFSRDPSAMTQLEMHANMFDTFIRNSAPKRIHWMDLLMTSLISIFTVNVVLTLRPLKGIGLLLIAASILTVIGFLFFWPFDVLIPMAHPLLAIFLCYYFFIPYRLIIENRRSWEYQQKNRLLSQVEELKTNFISMMSHDLKTPIARIQGMTEMILKDSSVALSPPQREAVDHIRSSGDDLLRFINSILNYAQIESHGVQLHLQTRDVNQILEEVAKKYEFLARLKQIQIQQEFEPLFPIRMDPELIRQVFSNLLENAIKYSPEQSKILITSEEFEGRVRVQVSDQGHGIPPVDLPHIFQKFFRSSNAKASPIKGSGLGLYLAHYFVDLHRGQISAESTVGQGSTFTVDLPQG